MAEYLVRDLMTVGVHTCKAATPVLDVARYLLEHNHLEEMVVLNAEGEGVGVCGIEQMLEVYGRGDLVQLPAEDVMREGVPEIPADIPIVLAAQILSDQGLRVAYLKHEAAGVTYPAAFISYYHILRSLVARDESELKDLGIAAERQAPLEAFIQRRDEARRKAELQSKSTNRSST